jgi:hypothetical protein
MYTFYLLLISYRHNLGLRITNHLLMSIEKSLGTTGRVNIRIHRDVAGKMRYG